MLKRWSIVMIVLVFAVLMVMPAASAGQGGTDRPFMGSATGMVQYGGDGNHDGLTNVLGCDYAAGTPYEEYFQVTSFTSADGQASHLGNVHLEFAHCPGLDGPLDGQMAMVAANGDVLYGEYAGFYAEDGIHVLATFMAEKTGDACYLLHGVPCESTGRFADVSGSLEMIADAVQTDVDEFIPWLWWGDWTGTLSY
jgi:hypothetical protein